MTPKRATILSSLLACGFAAVPAVAQEIYRWTDENGVVNFSDTAPATDSRAVSTVTVEDTRPSDYDPEADLYNVAAQAERMQALREEMKNEREARFERQRNAAHQQPVQATRSVGYAVPGWWWGQPGYGPPTRPPQRPERPVPEPYPTATLRPPGQTRN
jgi:hypothetical protein